MAPNPSEDKLLILVSFPQSKLTPKRVQEEGFRKFLQEAVAVHGGTAQIGMREDVFHSFALCLDPPLHYYQPEELGNADLTARYVYLRREQLDRGQVRQSDIVDGAVDRYKLVLTERGLPVPEID